MRQISLLLLAMLCSWSITFSQTITTFQDNLATPAGLEVDANGNVWVTQVGVGINDGKVSVIEPDGTIHDVITGLPSSVNPAAGETIGAWRTMQMPDNRLLVVSGEGSNALSGSLLTYDLTGYSLGDPAKDASDYESVFNVQDFVFAQGFEESNIYSVAMNAAGDMFIVDAAANAIIKRDIATDELSVFAEIENINTQFVPGNPAINAVPTKIISDGSDGFYVGTLTGFPFRGGTAQVLHLAADGTIPDTLAQFLTMVVDMAVDPTDGELVILEFGNFAFGQGFIPGSARLVKLDSNDSSYSTMADGFGPASAFTFDENGNAYASSIFTGEILKMEFEAPANDALCDAMPVTIGADCNGIPNINNRLATAETNEPDFICAGAPTPIVKNSVWYSFVAPENDVHILAVSDDPASDSPFQLSLFSSNNDCSDLSDLESLACNLLSTNLEVGGSLIGTGLTAGETYYVQVSGRLFNPFQTLYSDIGCLTISEITTPSNDDACNAISLEIDAPAQIFSNLLATGEEGEIAITPPSHSFFDFFGTEEGWALGSVLNNSVWFNFTTPADGGNFQIDLSASETLPGNFNAQAAVYEVEECGDFTTYTYVRAFDNEERFYLPNQPEIISAFNIAPKMNLFDLEGNKTYAIVVNGIDNFSTFFGSSPTRDQGIFSIAVETLASAEAATIETSDPTIICVGEDEMNEIDVEIVDPGVGEYQRWVITDEDLNITGFSTPPFRFNDVEPGVSFIWLLTYNEITGVEFGGNGSDFEGDFEISNPIEVIKVAAEECEFNDLELILYVDNQLYNQYEEVLYTVVASNNGARPATDVKISVGLPEGMVYSNHFAEAGEYNLYFETWTIDELAPGESVYFDLELFTLVSDVDIPNFVQVMSASGIDTDSSPGNNNSQIPTEDDEAAITLKPAVNGGVGGSVEGEDVDLELSIEGESATYTNFEDYVFTFTLTNNGEYDAYEVQVNLTPPTNAVYTGNAIDPLSISNGDFNGYFQTWKIPYLPAGETATMSIEVFPLIGNDPMVFYGEVFIVLGNDVDSYPGNGTAPTPNEDDEAVAIIENGAPSLVDGNESQALISTQSGLNLIKGGYQIFPNPASERITIAHQSVGEYLTNFQLLSVEGKVIRQYPIEMMKGLNTLEINVKDLENGMYFIQTIDSEGKSTSLRFTKM